MAMTPQAAWEFTKQLSSLPGPGGEASELEQAAQGKYADIGLAEYFPLAQLKENQQISVKIDAARDKMAAEKQAQEQGLPHPPQAAILEQLLAQERQRKGEPPMPQMQMSPMPEVQTPPPVAGVMPQQGIPGQAYGGLVGLQAGGLFEQAQGYSTPVSVDLASSNAVQEDEDDPFFGENFLRGTSRFLTGAGSLDELKEQGAIRTIGRTGLTALGFGLPALGAASKLFQGGRWLLGSGAAQKAGQAALGMGGKKGLTGWFGRRLAGTRPSTGGTSLAIPSQIFEEAGRTALRRGAMGGAGLLGLGTMAAWGDPYGEDATEEESYEDFMKRMFGDGDDAASGDSDKDDGGDGGNGGSDGFNDV